MASGHKITRFRAAKRSEFTLFHLKFCRKKLQTEISGTNNVLIMRSNTQFFAIPLLAEQCFAARLAMPIIDGVIFPNQPYFAAMLNADFSSVRTFYAR